MAEGIFNFSAGPSVLPESALRRAAAELENYRGSGMSVMEMSHRSKLFQEIFDSAKSKLKEVMAVPDSHEILFLQGGATLQFAAIPMNLIRAGTADYAVTGNFSGKAAKEAKKYGQVNLAFDGTAEGHVRVPGQAELVLSEGAEYFYYCANNTIYGTEWHYTPDASAPLVCDMSSDILSKPVNVSDFGLIYAGAQKNMAPAGLTVVIVDKKLLAREAAYTPEVMSYKNMADKDSMLNTPPCWCIYMLSLVLDWVKEQGGLSAMEQLRTERSKLIYDVLDESRFYIPHAHRDSRSMMNVSFRCPSAELDGEFVRGAAERGLVNLKGHKLTGGLRASLYNAMPIEGAVKLAQYMKEFEVRNV